MDLENCIKCMLWDQRRTFWRKYWAKPVVVCACQLFLVFLGCHSFTNEPNIVPYILLITGAVCICVDTIFYSNMVTSWWKMFLPVTGFVFCENKQNKQGQKVLFWLKVSKLWFYFESTTIILRWLNISYLVKTAFFSADHFHITTLLEGPWLLIEKYNNIQYRLLKPDTVNRVKVKNFKADEANIVHNAFTKARVVFLMFLGSALRLCTYLSASKV